MLALALWVGAWLGGRAATDDTLGALGRLQPDVPPGELLAAVRRTGADRVWLLLPRPGRVLGWPRDLAAEPEPALLLCREDEPAAVIRTGPTAWRVDPVRSCEVAPLAAAALSPRAAARVFATAVSGAALQLERLDLARAVPEPLPRRWSAALGDLPAGLDPSAVAVLARAAAVLDALDAGLASDGAALSAGQARARADALREVTDAVLDVVTGLVGGLVGLPVACGP